MLRPLPVGESEEHADDPRWAPGVTIVAVAFRRSSFRARPCLEAHGVDSEGSLVLLARRQDASGSPQEWEELFSTLLTRGPRIDSQLLVDAGMCPVLRPRILGAWGPRVVFLP